MASHLEVFELALAHDEVYNVAHIAQVDVEPRRLLHATEPLLVLVRLLLGALVLRAHMSKIF